VLGTVKIALQFAEIGKSWKERGCSAALRGGNVIVLIWNLECSSKAYVLKAWSPAWHWWEMVEALSRPGLATWLKLSTSRVPTLQAHGPGFKIQYRKTERERERERERESNNKA
jgi:hypothetical protein